MPDDNARALQRAHEDERQGKAPTTQAAEPGVAGAADHL